MGIALPIITAFGVSLAINWLLARRLIKPLEILAQVNRRSAHKVPVPIGGGIGILIGSALGFVLSGTELPYQLWVSCAVLAIVSLVNDKHDISAKWRLLIQVILAAWCISAIAYLPPVLFLLLCFALLWFTNLYNFMDGSDGLMAVQTIAIAFGFWLITGEVWPLCILAATLAFFYFNAPLAKIFSGDVGSIPIGFFLGFVLIDLGFSNFKASFYTLPVSLLILPLYFVADASITLFKRLLRREKIWHAHAEHYYQQALKKGFSHQRVMFTVAGLNAFLVACAYISLFYPAPAFVVSALAVLLCLWHFRKP